MSDTILHKTGKPFFFDPKARRIRSFVTRAGRVTSGQEKAFKAYGDAFLTPYEKRLLDFESLFGRDADTVFEIGFGMGETTAEIAEMRPETNFIGAEVHTPGVGNLLKLAGEKNLKNIRIIQHDAVEILENMIPDASLAGCHVFFPDPWHKARHKKRRLIQPDFVKFLAGKIRPGGYIHCATDWEDYAEQMLEVLSAEPALSNTAKGYAVRPETRPITKFEKRGLGLGHGIRDLVFTKI